MISDYNPELLHKRLYAELKPELSYSDDCDYLSWKSAVALRFAEIIRKPKREIVPEPIIEYTKNREGYTEIRYSFESEKGYFVPCHLLIPDTGKDKYAVIICLQGHSSGMHISLGHPKYEGDERDISSGDRDFAIRAVKEGFAALVMEQRAFGECQGSIENQHGNRCNQISVQALLLGRTLIGERALDISQAIDTLSSFEKTDTDRIACMGNSGGGTATYYASCTEPRIKAVMPSCSFCTVKASIFDQHHCVCNYMPDMLKYFEMQDLACLIAPRPLIIVSGKTDAIFPIDAAKKGFDTVCRIYEREGLSENCAHVIGDGGHRFYADDAWPVFKRITGWN